METTQTMVNTSVKNGVMTIELTFDPGNCYTHEMMKQLDTAILQARFDNAVQAIVLRGAGEKFFCAGADINMLKTADPTFKYYFCLHANETLNRLEHTPKIVIAALNGHTVGGGLEIAMAADIRIARKGAGKVGAKSGKRAARRRGLIARSLAPLRRRASMRAGLRRASRCLRGRGTARRS